MAEYLVPTVLAAFVFAYSLVAVRLDRSPLSAAMVAVFCGLIAGPAGLGMVNLGIRDHGMKLLAELTLAIVLFTDSSKANLSVLRRFEEIPVRLLLIGLPLTILFGAGLGAVLFPQFQILEMTLLATMLAPTDAALGKPVITNREVPTPVRESLNVESGLNDGICVPIVLLFLALTAGEAKGWDIVQLATWLPVQAIGVGVIAGVMLGVMGSSALRMASNRNWIRGSWLDVPTTALAILCFSFAQYFGGSGFIASFVGGMTFGALTKSHKHAVLEAAESVGDTLALLTWFVFGAVLLSVPLRELNANMLVYAILSLTVIRMVPVLVSVMGLGLKLETKLFLGWFGPRGLASLVFAMMMRHEHALPHANMLMTIVSWTIFISIIAHGVSANPLAKLYAEDLGASPEIKLINK